MLNKKLIIITSVSLGALILALGYLVYLKFSKGSATEIGNQSAINANSQNQNDKGASRLADTQVLSPVLHNKGGGISFFDRSGKLYTATLTINSALVALNPPVEIQIPPRNGLAEVIWPLSGQNFIVRISENGIDTYQSMDSSIAAYTQLPKEITKLAWSGNGDNYITYVWVSGDKATLNQSRADGSGYAKIIDLKYTDTDISVSPDGSLIAFWGTKNPTQTNKIFTVTKDGKSFGEIASNGYNTDVVWAPDSNQLLYNSRTEDGSAGLWYKNLKTGLSKNLQIDAHVSNTVWDLNRRIIAVTIDPASNEERLVIHNISEDTKQVISPGANLKPRDLFLSQDSKILFFRSDTDDALYSLALP